MTLLKIFVFGSFVVCSTNGIGIEPVVPGLNLHNRKLEYKPNMMHHRFSGLVFDPVKTKLLHSLSVEYSEEYCEETDDEYPEAQCPPNEIPVTNLVCCESTCSDKCPADDSCSYSEMASTSCICESGYVRNNGVCIPLTSCPEEQRPLISGWSPRAKLLRFL